MSAQSTPTPRDPRTASTVNVHEAKTHLSRLLERVEAGERITIARNGRPVAELVAPPPPGVRIGVSAGRFEFDPEAFNAPDPDLVALFEGS